MTAQAIINIVYVVVVVVFSGLAHYQTRVIRKVRLALKASEDNRFDLISVLALIAHSPVPVASPQIVEMARRVLPEGVKVEISMEPPPAGARVH